MTARPPAFAYAPPAHRGLAIVHREDSFLVLDKPSGLLSVPGRGEDKQDCLASRVQAEYPDALIVHRLDMETSGLLVMARGEEAQRRLSRLFRERQVDKRYVAVVAGALAADEGQVNLPLITDWPNRPRQKVDFELGKPSLTRFRVLGRDPAANTTRVELEPVSGRSHQLRVHMQSLGHPILGDPLYGGGADHRRRLLLHATHLAFPHPFSQEAMAFACPADF
ncbi:MAG TPA: RluA family pseudouridine synthase [Rhodocyclaceae bacterium]|nr:RluA family pseudouridine synthase [Rhodocyclaceae bacterium]